VADCERGIGLLSMDQELFLALDASLPQFSELWTLANGIDPNRVKSHANPAENCSKLASLWRDPPPPW